MISTRSAWGTITVGAVLMLCGVSAAWADPPAGGSWELVFSDEFNGTTADLDRNWLFQNGPSGHILCSRWRENVIAEEGLCRLLNKKEQRGGQDWTSGSMWTRESFQYGYFECRYRYGKATGLNNSFWIMTQGKERPEVPVRFEIDINEGHYPNKVNTNIHRWSGEHITSSRSFRIGVEAGHNFLLTEPVETNRLRLVARDPGRVRVSELRVFATSADGYPPLLPGDATASSTAVNLALRATATASSELSTQHAAAHAIDGRLEADSRWVSGDVAGPHVLTLDLGGRHPIGCVQVLTGTKEKDGEWVDPISDFTLEAWNGRAWTPLDPAASPRLVDLSRDFHVYGLEWNERELVFYFDGQPLRREPNEFCHGAAPVLLSSAIIAWAGTVTEAIDGTSMDVDWVRVYRRPQ